MGYGASFNPIPPSNANFDPNRRGNPMVDPNKSLLPNCGDRTHTKERIRKEWEAFNDNFGYRANYQQIGNTMENTDHLFGEGADVPFQNGRIIKGFLDIQNSMGFFSQLGMERKVNINFYITIQEFYSIFGVNAIPNVGDLFYFLEDNCDAPEKVKPLVYKVTYKDRLNAEDFMFGDYIWKLSATRADNSHEPNAMDEDSNQLNDSTFSGLISSVYPNAKLFNNFDYENSVERQSTDDFVEPKSTIYGGFR